MRSCALVSPSLVTLDRSTHRLYYLITSPTTRAVRVSSLIAVRRIAFGCNSSGFQDYSCFVDLFVSCLLGGRSLISLAGSGNGPSRQHAGD